MLNRKEFINNFKDFDKNVVLEIIDIFIKEYPERISKLKKNIDQKDFEALKFNAHSLKGVVANFVVTEPYELAKQLEYKGRDKISEGLNDLFEKLKTTTGELVNDLKDIRKEYM